MTNKLDKDYLALCQDILDKGTKKETRNGGTISVFGRQIRHSMKDGFPLLTTKKMAFKTMVTELLWFLRGDTNIKFLVDNGCHIWDGDAYKNYEKWWKSYSPGGAPIPLSKEEFINRIKTDDEFAKKWGALGKIYGHQWRKWGERRYDSIDNEYFIGTDQIANLINKLKTNPDDRRMIVTAWNPSEVDSCVLPPCHYGFQVYTRELSEQERWELYVTTSNRLKTPTIKGSTNKEQMEEYYKEYNIPTRAISLMYNARSQDVPLGTPFNIASYALLLDIIAKMVNMAPDELITNMGDCHIYLNQIDGIKEQLTRKPYELPKLVHMKTDDFYKSLSENLSLLSHLDIVDFQIKDYKSHPSIKFPLSN
jgi:thymidylate synthase